MTDTCGTCKHWIPWGEAHRSPMETWVEDGRSGPEMRDDEGEGLRCIADGDWGYCGRVGLFGPSAAGKFYVIDGSEYVAKLGTRSDFGCTEHEPDLQAVADEHNRKELARPPFERFLLYADCRRCRGSLYSRATVDNGKIRVELACSECGQEPA